MYRVARPRKTRVSAAPFRPGVRTISTTRVSLAFFHTSSMARFRGLVSRRESQGAVASYLIESEVAAALPARSVHVPLTTAAPLSGPEYPADEHAPIPDRPSVPDEVTVSGWLYQPFASGARSAVAVAEGAVLSSLIVTLLTVSSGPFWAEHVNFVPAYRRST